MTVECLEERMARTLVEWPVDQPLLVPPCDAKVTGVLMYVHRVFAGAELIRSLLQEIPEALELIDLFLGGSWVQVPVWHVLERWDRATGVLKE